MSHGLLPGAPDVTGAVVTGADVTGADVTVPRVVTVADVTVPPVVTGADVTGPVVGPPGTPVQVVPLSAKLEGTGLLEVHAPLKPNEVFAPVAMAPLYDTLLTVTC